ncbi:uncharacterized protein LOC115219174 [Argonauta hians]
MNRMVREKTVLLVFLAILALVSSQSTIDTNLDRFCEDCVVYTGAGYYSHPLRCDVFVHCFASGDNRTVQASVKECPSGLYWSQKDLTCRYPSEVECTQDPCKQPGRIGIRSIFACAAYFKCKGGILDGTRNCCNDFHRFDENTQTCVADKLCRSKCGENNVSTTASPHTPLAPLCDKKAVPNDNRFYIQMVHRTAYRMPCPLGTIFSEDSCSCVRGTKKIVKPSQECSPFIYLPFDKNGNDYSKYPKGTGSKSMEYVDVNGAVSGAALFNDSSVTVWALNNMFFGSNFTLSFRFRPATKRTGYFALADNSDCNIKPTFLVAYLNEGSSQTLIGGVVLEDKSVVRLKTELKQPYEWHNVTLLKTGPRIELWLDGQKTSALGYANIEKRDCSLTIGRGTGMDSFVGYIDELKFYKCTPEKYL